MFVRLEAPQFFTRLGVPQTGGGIPKLPLSAVIANHPSGSRKHPRPIWRKRNRTHHGFVALETLEFFARLNIPQPGRWVQHFLRAWTGPLADRSAGSR